MAPRLVRLALRRSLGHVRHVQAVRPRQAGPLVAEVYRQVERDFGMLAPPVGLHSPAPEVLAASWMILRETLVSQGVADRASKELVATGVSEANSCPYCADVHGMTLESINGAADPAGPLAALAAWSRGTGTAAGAAAPPATPEQAPELIGTAVTFHYYNRMVNVFLGESPIPPHVPESARPRARRVLTWIMRPPVRGPRLGETLDLLPPVRIPDELAWARPNELLADAFARAYAAVEAAGIRSVPPSVRDLVHTRLSIWDGQPPGLSRSWLASAVAALPESDRPAGQLALAIALASYQVSDDLIDEFRDTTPGDDKLIELTAWSSLAAARRISTWLATATPASA